jgi:PAS domain S-box-containing protein
MLAGKSTCKEKALLATRESEYFAAANTLIARWLLAACALSVVAASPAATAHPGPEKSVLILYSFSDRSVFDPLESLKSAVRSQVQAPVNFYVEYMETQRFEDPDYETSFSQTLRHAHAGEKLDLVVVVAFPALRFAVLHRDAIFPGVPIVFSSVHEGGIRGRKMWPGVTGVTVPVDVGGTLALALRMHPNMKTVAVVTGTSEFERYWLGVVHSELRRYEGKLNVIDLVGLPANQLLERASALPPNTFVLYQTSPRDSIQPVIGAYDALAIISRRLPTYSIFSYCLDHGCIGGSYSAAGDQSRRTAKLAARILSGEEPENIPVAHGSAGPVRVDWRQLRKWKLPEAALPAGSVVLYREPTAWQRHKGLIAAIILGIAAQTFWMIALLWQRARARRALATLSESEERFQRMADTAPALIWMSDKCGRITYLNEKRLDFTSGTPKAGLGDAWTQYIHPDDLQNVHRANSRALGCREGFSKEYRLRRRDGVYRWMLDIASPRTSGDGSFVGFIGSAIDVTEQKLAKEALERVSGRLIEAQEKERSRIARELHDDICQRLALLSLELEQAIEGSETAQNDSRWPAIRRQCSEIASDVQALSHELHSSKLDYLGLAAAVRSFCGEFSKQHGVVVDFKVGEMPKHLSREVSLCLFRIAQEALHNGLKHSGVYEFTVRLSGTPDHVNLEIRDSGIGFDLDQVIKGNGLGLVSMQERIHVVSGSISIDSKPNRGTRVIASVPLNTNTAALAAGTGAA